MRIKDKTITFHSVATEFEITRPVLASRSTPDWFRKMPGVSEDQIMTVKKCVPFLDSLTSGYQILLPADVAWSKKDQKFTSNSAFPLNSDHAPSQTSIIPVPEEFAPQPHKWVNFWHVKTPKGYSCLFTHPLNRPDLPFMSFTGIVDTDKHPMAVNFPFWLKKDFDGTIKAGTPLIQIIPFKRESWGMNIKDQGQSHFYPYDHKVEEPPFGFYKRNFWSKKRYA